MPGSDQSQQGYSSSRLNQDVEHLFGLTDFAIAHQAEWLRRMLAGAVATLAILAGIGPDAISEIQQVFLVATWVLLGLGIVSGAGAIYIETSVSWSRAQSYRKKLAKAIKEDQPLKSRHIAAGEIPRWVRLARWVMVCTLLLAIVSLVVYMVASTLAI